jgi:carbamoylphosphate synthase large subunit
MLFTYYGRTNRFELVFEADEKRIWQRFWVKMIGVDVNAINITETESNSNNYLKKLDTICACKYVLPTEREIAQGLVSFDASFLYIRRYRAAIVYKRRF